VHNLEPVSVSQSDDRRRGDKRSRTREALIEAAVAVVRQQGYAQTSLDDIAAYAGMTRGSIYGNFKDRNDLFAAVAIARSPPIIPRPMPGTTFKAQMRAMGKAVARAARERRPDGAHRAAFQLHVLSDESMRRRLEAQNNNIRRRILTAWKSALPVDPLPMPPERLIKVISALTDGLLTAHFQSPEQFNETVIVSAFEALAT
jgi:AcrR family transcriptional regulator